MADGFLGFVRVILPTFFLLMAPLASHHALGGWGSYREIFANENVYLDAYFKVNPKGRFQNSPTGYPVRFEGYWVTKTGATHIEGTYQKVAHEPRFTFTAGDSMFEGQVVTNGKCGLMKYKVSRLSGKKRTPASEGILSSCR